MKESDITFNTSELQKRLLANLREHVSRWRIILVRKLSLEMGRWLSASSKTGMRGIQNYGCFLYIRILMSMVSCHPSQRV